VVADGYKGKGGMNCLSPLLNKQSRALPLG
jgi:hypothetical protein